MEEFLNRLRREWKQWYGEWYAVALSLTRNTADAEDLVSEVLCRTLKARPNLDGSRRSRNYISLSIRNRFYEQQRRRRARWILAQMLQKESEHFQSSVLQEILDARASEAYGRVVNTIWDYVAKLPDEERRAIGLRFRTDDDSPRGFREVAAALDVSLGKAHALVSAALALLAAMILEDFE